MSLGWVLALAGAFLFGLFLPATIWGWSGPCRHRWEEVGRFFDPGIGDVSIGRASFSTAQSLIEASRAVTTIHSRCMVCGVSRFDRIFGRSASSPPTAAEGRASNVHRS